MVLKQNLKRKSDFFFDWKIHCGENILFIGKEFLDNSLTAPISG